ncbi:MAG: alpha-glucosidase [Bacteroidales bacterium]|jgi:oligo-1,6-glucosidase
MKKAWYKEGFVYQIYPRSFQDSNGDGMGDIPGIIQRIPYLVDLGISIVWLSPVYQSPNDDNGYDISDYRDILKDFGTLEDMKRLIAAFHENHIKIVMDLVVNHTSDEHPWFQASIKKDPKYADYYYWKEKKGNWGSFFGGDAWTWNEERQAYYLHLFSKKQPDLNWNNPDVRKEVQDICQYWLDLGIDGFRCDVINLIAKADGLPDGKWAPFLRGREHYVNNPKIHEYLQELNTNVLDKYDCFTVGETALIDIPHAIDYVGGEKRELDMLFQFSHMDADNYLVKWFVKKFKPFNLKKPLSKWQNGLLGKGWNTLYLENHDQPRSVSRFGSDAYHKESAKMLATMLFFQQGTPFMYQGQEIGMKNAAFEKLDEYQDIETHNVYKLGREKLHFSHRFMMKQIKYASRDNARTPMQWDSSPQAGFTTGAPWLKVNPNYQSINVAQNKEDPESILAYYKKIIALRKQHQVIVYGDYQDVLYQNRKLYAYTREYEGDQLFVLCNFTGKEQKYNIKFDFYGYELILTNYPNVEDSFRLKPYEARVYLKKKLVVKPQRVKKAK